jgi:hypothetical protein
MGKRQMSKKEMEELRKKEQEEAAAQVRWKDGNNMKRSSLGFMCYLFFSICLVLRA